MLRHESKKGAHFYARNTLEDESHERICNTARKLSIMRPVKRLLNSIRYSFPVETQCSKTKVIFSALFEPYHASDMHSRKLWSEARSQDYEGYWA